MTNMAIPGVSLPESAPFSSAQRAWLNGFFSGLLQAAGAMARTAPPPGEAAPNGAPPASPAAAEAAAEEEFPWHDPALPMADRLKLADGRPKARLLMAAMAQLDCGACGYECRSYAEAIDAGTEKDLTRCAPGGAETAKKLRELVGLTIHARSAAPADRPAAQTKRHTPPPGGAYNRNYPFPARLVASRALNGPGSAKDTRHVVISLHRALSREYCIGTASPALLELLAESATDRAEREQLAAAARGEAPEVAALQVADLLLRFRSARPAAAKLVGTLSSLRPRLYSISSSPRLHPQEVHLTVGVVRYSNAHGRLCKGVASNFLAERTRPGMEVRAFVQSSPHFRPPADPATPMIMVGPGTGIAPFRAFLQHRQAAAAAGPAWLLFGDQHEATDFLYRPEIEAFMRAGVLTRLDTAFSRDGDQKVYVQHRMRQHGAEMWSWLRRGAHVYVCGDAKRMAADVDRALREIIAEHGQVDADAYVAELSRNRRYQKDVY